MRKTNGLRLFAYAYFGCSILAILILVSELKYGTEGPIVFYAFPGNQSAIYGFYALFGLGEGPLPWLSLPVGFYVLALPVLIILACYLLDKMQKAWLMNILLLVDAAFPVVMFVFALSDFTNYMQAPQVVAMWIGGLLDLGCLAVLFVIKRRGLHGRTENLKAMDTGKP